MDVPLHPRFVVRSSYGNDSVALIQWAREQGLVDITVLYSETGWARRWWREQRVPKCEAWVQSLGYVSERTTVSAGMEDFILGRNWGWPMRLSQWCTSELKMKPTAAWLAHHDPDCRAVMMVGLRREESEHRKAAPHFRACSADDGGRTVLYPLVEHTSEQRDALLARAGFEPLPHRSEECRCINSGKADIVRWDEDDIAEIERIEQAAGVTSKGKPRVMFRRNKHMGATGIREIVAWAHSPRGQYVGPKPDEEESITGCLSDWCGS